MRLLGQRQHVAHAEDALRHAVRMEGLEIVEAFADAHELDGLAENRAQAERCATACIAVELGQHHTRKRNAPVELLRDAERLLPGHGVEHEQRFLRRRRLAHRLQLVHELVVDVQAPRRVDDHDVA